MIRVGFIGAGFIAESHAKAVRKSGLAEVVSVYAPDDSAARLAASCGAKVAASAADIIASPEIDAVSILSPTHTHADLLRQVHAAGKHVLCEKPLVRTVAEADEIAALFAGYRPVAMAGMVLRFWPEYRQLRDSVKAGDIGSIGTIRMVRGVTFPLPSDAWRGDFAKSGGVLLDVGIHDLDFVDWAFGPVTRVFTMRSQPDANGRNEYALVVARTVDGAIAHFEISGTEAPGAFYYGFEVAGSAGLIEMDSRTEPPLTVRPADGTPPRIAYPMEVTPHCAMVSAFLNAVATGAPSPVPMADGARAARLALAAYQSSQDNAPVEL